MIIDCFVETQKTLILIIFNLMQLFRETKEGEFQHLLRKKRESENHLSKLLIGLPESLHNSTMSDFGDLGKHFGN